MNRLLSFLFVCLMQVSLAVASTYNLRVEVTPNGSGSLNTSEGTYEEGSTINLRTYSNTGYVFKGWYEGATLLSSSTSFNYTMPSKDVLVQAKYEYDPTVPGNPSMPDTTTLYSFTAIVSPLGAGSINTTASKYAAGATVSLQTYNNTGYKFVGWQNEEGVNLSTTTSFNYTMPNHDVKLTALYFYDPTVPANPDSMATRYTVTLAPKPIGGGSFNTTSATIEQGGNVHLYAYANTGYEFLHWENEKGEIISSEQNFYFVMPHGNAKLYGVFDYNPAPPSNPNKNYWNKELGELIVDDFTPGNLGSAVSSAISGSDRGDVAMMTVSGKMNDNDFGIANDYTNCTLLDLSRVTGVTEVPSYAFDNTNIESIYLPVTIEKIGYGAFYNCQQLSALTIYAMVPPVLEENVFAGIKEGLVVYVPAVAIVQYQEADVWKDFTILPIQEDIRSISISLPEGSHASDYSQMWLELTNTKNGQKMHYIMTDRSTYTFANIIRNTSWNVVLRNERGDVFGQIDNIEVKDDDVSVCFASLLKPQSVSVSVKTPDGMDVTANTQVTWLDDSGSYLLQAKSLAGLLPGNGIAYKVELSQDLSMLYLAPQQTAYVVNESDNNIQITLTPIGKVTLSGLVKDYDTKAALSGATVTASQTFGGKYSKTVSTKTNSKGNYTIEVGNVPTSLAVSVSDYIGQTIVCDSLMTGSESVKISDISLKTISGAVITLDLTYTRCPSTLEDADTLQSWYADYNNIAYSIYNQTKHKAISQFNVQYPQIVLLEDVDEGDVLELTATSKNNAFMPVKATACIDAEQRADASFNIVELGKITSSFTNNSNASVVGSLYDANGKLIKSYDYTNASLTIGDLFDGAYTLVTMGSSKLFNSIYDLSQLPQTGLVLGSDYTQSSVDVKSGKVCVIDIDEVPTLDESKLYYTGDNTSFTVNKPSIVAGNYLTLTGHIDFKTAYAGNVSNVNLIVDLPESCQFVENSVMVGNSMGSYTLQNNRVMIPLARYTDRVRFCIIPTLGGEYAPSALAQFDVDGKTVTQPIGSAFYTAKDLSISVPSTVAKTTIPVSGTAIGASKIEIYDGDVLIGQTTSLANGTWATKCELNEPYNLSKHEIYAKVITNQGLELRSENVECSYNKNAIKVSKVTMYHDNPEMNQTYEVVFDFINPKEEDQYYIYYIYNKKFTFTIEFTSNDTTKISNVVLNVKTGNGEIINLPASFDKKQEVWVASGEFGNMYDGNIPVNVSVDYYCEVKNLVDRAYIEDQKNGSFTYYQNNLDERKVAIEESSLVAPDNTIFDSINNTLEADSLDIGKLNEMYEHFNIEGITVADSLDDATIDNMMLGFTEDYNKWKDNYSTVVDSIIDDFYFNEELSSEMSAQNVQYDGIINSEMSKLTDSEIQLLIKDGYSFYQLTDSSKVYYKYTESGFDFIDVQKKMRYRLYKNALNNSIRKSEAVNESINECAKSISATIIKIKNLYETGGLSLTDAFSQFGDLLNFIDCYYAAIMINVDVKLTKGYDNAIINYNDKISKRENLKKISLSRIDKFRDRLVSDASNKKYVDDLLAAGEKQLLNSDLSPEEFKELSQKCKEWKQQSQYYDAEIKSYKAALKKENNTLAALVNQLNDLKKGKATIEKAKANINKILAKIPKKIGPKGKLGKIIGIGGKLAGYAGDIVSLWSIGADVWEMRDELKEWVALEEAIDRKLPCEKDAERALALQMKIHKESEALVKECIIIISSEIAGLSVNLNLGVPVASLSWWIGSAANIYAEWRKFLGIQKFIEKRGDFWLDMMYLKCTGKEPDDPRKDKDKDNNKDNDKNQRHEDSGNKDSGTGIDPSGYVYEAVFSNRVEGATATVFYKENVEDMYGDLHENIVKWNAEEYAQENPLFTDENGYYRWDVPQGLWQVKFEKEGYETTYSEWLPVPPPQLDINIAMKQNVQPNVKNARAYEDAVEVEFDKYMMPELLNTDNIIVMDGGKQVDGIVELLNEELKYEGETESFASKLRFNAKAPFEGDEVTLMINNRVKSYAGIRMQDNYSQSFAIEQEIHKMVCDSVVVVGYGSTAVIPVTVLPATASSGKVLNVRASSSMILGTDVTSVVLDDSGKAVVNVSGELPGTATLTFTIEGYDMSATTIVNVEQINQTEVAAPTANIASGTTVKKGTRITLSCKTEGATIYYTLDGSCPCDETSRLVYTEPIVINESVTIKAMAVAPDKTESDIVEFTFIVDDENGIDDVTIDENLKIYPLPVRDKLNVNAGGKIIKSVTLTNMDGSTVVKAPKSTTLVSIDVSSLASGIYIINVATEDKVYSRKIMKI